MSNLVFRNYDKKAIKNLLKDIGEERFMVAVKDCGMPDKPLRMEGFYIEFQPDKLDFILFFMYPSGTVYEIMEVNGFWTVPDKGWETKRLEI